MDYVGTAHWRASLAPPPPDDRQTSLARHLEAAALRARFSANQHHRKMPDRHEGSLSARPST